MPLRRRRALVVGIVELVLVDERVGGHDQVYQVLAPGAPDVQGGTVNWKAEVGVFQVEGSVRLMQIQVEDEGEVVGRVWEKRVEANARTQHHEEIEVVLLRIQSDLWAARIVCVVVIEDKFTL